jgi:integrase
MSLAEAQRSALGFAGEKAPAGTVSVRELAERFYTARIVNGRKHNGEVGYKRPEQVRHYFDRDLLGSSIADLNLSKVTRAHLAQLIEHKVAHGGPVAANRLTALVKRMFAYAVAVGLLENSPAALLDRSIAGGKEYARTRVLNDIEIKQLWLIDDATCNHAALFRFLLLSGQRISEAQSATWHDFDLETGVWRIDENKSSRRHKVSVSHAMREIIEQQPRERYGNATVGPFATASTTAAQAWLKRWCNREEITPSFTPHDLRRTFATRVRDDLGVSFDVVEKILNHAAPTKVAGIYQRGDLWQQRINAMSAWATHLTFIVKDDRPDDNVTDIRSAA